METALVLRLAVGMGIRAVRMCSATWQKKTEALTLEVLLLKLKAEIYSSVTTPSQRLQISRTWQSSPVRKALTGRR